jgi:tRNA pseudouridine13 synthase
LSVPPLDEELGIRVYASKSLGVGGSIRETVDDFVVQEVLVDGSKAPIDGAVLAKVLGSTEQKQRFLLCILVKRNWDTFIAVKNIAQALGIDQGRVQIAGIKDAKAVTAQHLTIEGCSFDDASKIDVKDIQVHPIGYIREALSTFYLLGNYFTINIKNINENEPEVKQRIFQTMQELDADGGMPNFFGHQRFGTTRPITHLVGKAILKGDFEQAAMLFLAKPSPHEHPNSRQARKTLQETKDFKDGLETFPKQLRFERLMLNHLSDNPEDFVGAFQRLPVKLQELFVQAYQSYMFNRFLSERINRGYFLNRAEVGDYVVAIERNGLPLTSVTKTVTEETLGSVNEQLRVGKLRVALPIVGLRQKQSQGVMGKIEREVIAKEGIDFETLMLNELSRRGGKGGLRAAITPIKEFNLQNLSCNSSGEGLCVQLSFRFFRGSYATVLLREIMKPFDPIAAGF